MILLIGLATLICTLLGGLFALKFKDKLHLILGFSAGAVIGVAFFDLIPESIELSSARFNTATATSLTGLGFIIFMILDRFILIHGHSHNDDNCANESHRGAAGAATLSLHSLLDGLAVGLAFKVSISIGVIVAVAVLAHDFSDGINTVNLILKNKGATNRAFKWLLVDAFAPVIGILSSLFFTLPETTLGLMLALFAGFFLYIGASDLLPESHHRHPTFITTLMTVFGAAVLYTAIHLAAI